MVFRSVHILPIVTFVLMPATFILTYTISVSLKHVEPDFPYISDTGTYSPESCIFGQLMNIASVLIISNVIIRYAHIRTYYQEEETASKILQMNRISVWLGIISGCGISLVANFQETNVLVIHSIGAFMCFGPGTCYLWFQALMSYKTMPNLNTLLVARLRIALAIICTIAFITSSVTGPLSFTQFHGKERTKWYPEDGGFALHVISTAAEWTLAIAFDFFILTFIREFQQIYIGLPQLYVAEENQEISSPSEEERASWGNRLLGDEDCQPTRPFRELLA